MGGGFGGCTINLIHKRFIDEFIEEASKSYFEKFSINLTPIEINICDGVKIKKPYKQISCINSCYASLRLTEYSKIPEGAL